jgi:peptidoglycan/xylan/chitin deacetylase (PgdA/CDA1 family)
MAKAIRPMPQLERGVFTISLDFELLWGTLDLFGPAGFRRACELEREVIVDRLLNLLAEFDISATWCTVGHLFLESCKTTNGERHPEIVRPTHSWCEQDWFAHDAGGNEAEAPLLLGRSLIEKIRACPVPQEIGSHSFSHVIFGDPGCSKATAESELAACVEAAREVGVELRSFAFPRNQVGHLETLRQYGFTVYRGPEPNWYEAKPLPGVVKRLAHFCDVFTAATPPTVLPEYAGEGLWNVPGSMIYFPMHGIRRYIPMSLRVRRAIKGLNAAAREKRVFHLWLHPTNLADQTETMFDGLRAILKHAHALRARRDLEILPMGKLATISSLEAEPIA